MLVWLGTVPLLEPTESSKPNHDLSLKEYDGEGATAVDLDTGIDGEHPDFDCGEPWTGEKLIWSAKWTGLAWVDAPNCNSDTSSGHGTHVEGQLQETVTPPGAEG